MEHLDAIPCSGHHHVQPAATSLSQHGSEALGYDLRGRVSAIGIGNEHDISLVTLYGFKTSDEKGELQLLGTRVCAIGSNNERIKAMKTLSRVRPAVASATIIRAASAASSWIHEILGEQFGLDPIKKNLNLRAEWGRKIDAWTVVSKGDSPLAVLAESSRGEITAARCLAVEVRSDDSVLVLGSETRIRFR